MGGVLLNTQSLRPTLWSWLMQFPVSIFAIFLFSSFFLLTFLDFFFCPLVFCLHTQMVYIISRKVNEYFPWQLYWERGFIGWILKFLSISCISWQNCINTLGQAWIMGWKNTVFQVTETMKLKRCILQMMFFVPRCQFWPKRKVCMAGYDCSFPKGWKKWPMIFFAASLGSLCFSSVHHIVLPSYWFWLPLNRQFSF